MPNKAKLEAENKRLWKFVEDCCAVTASEEACSDSCFEIAKHIDTLYADTGHGRKDVA